MMGYSHSVSAAACWLALHQTGIIVSSDTPTLIVTTLAAAGAGMLPDIDHPRGSIAQSIPPLTGWVSRLVSSLAGGHRKGTHSLLGLAALWGLAYGADRLLYAGIPVRALLLPAFAGGIALRNFKAPGGWAGALLLPFLTLNTQALDLMPWVILTGASTHIVGDALTTQGINPLWPLSLKAPVSSPFWRRSGYMSIPLLGSAGSLREKILTTGLSLYILYAALAHLGF